MAGAMLDPPRGANGKRRYRPMAEINMIPLIDVMLVLLIIFMVSAPLLTVGVNVDLPRTSANPVSSPDEPISVSITAEGRVFIQETAVEIGDLVPRLRAIAEARGGNEARIFVRGDRALAYGRVMEVMGLIAQAGFTRVALLAEQPAGREPARLGAR
ncbi:MAG: protein TolR [Acetobacteraceae bacterium]|nr:protein TolR [Acetobacteraceae bacterium]